MKEKVYVVFQEWEDASGERDSQILAVTRTEEDAIKVLQEERAEILANFKGGKMTVEEIENDEDYDLEDTPTRFWLQDLFGGWDEITIIEKVVK